MSSASAPCSALWFEIGDSLLERFRAAATVARRLAVIEKEVMAGTALRPPQPGN